MAMRERRERGRKLPQVKPKKFGGGRTREKKMEKREKEKKKKTKRKSKEGKKENEGECVIRERRKKKMNDTSLRDLRRTRGRNASGQETKLVHTTRATHEYQKLRVSSRSKK